MADNHVPGDPGHGHSTAAWTGTGLILLGSLLVSLGMILAMQWLWMVGVLVTVGGVAAWVGLNKAGYGANGSKVVH